MEHHDNMPQQGKAYTSSEGEKRSNLSSTSNHSSQLAVWRQQCGATTAEFLRRFNPDLQYRTGAVGMEYCLEADSPTLNDITSMYGEAAPVQWLIPQVTSINEFFGGKDMMTISQVEQAARVLYLVAKYIKISVLLHFFFVVTTGSLGKVYGAFTPATLMEYWRAYQDSLNTTIESLYRKKEQDRETTGITAEEFFRRNPDRIGGDLWQLLQRRKAAK